MTHTPGPWELDEYCNIVRDSEVAIDMAWIIAKPDRSERGVYPPSERDANARFIVKACNVHEELLRELKSAIFYIETYGGDVTKSFSAGGNLDAVKAIIAKAEGKE